MRKITLFFCLFFSVSLGAQDVHFTLFDFAPNLVNPALTGAFSGTVRIGGIFRDQYFGNRTETLSGEAFTDLDIYADGNIIRGFKKTHWVAAGIGFTKHNAGELRISNRINAISLAYHIGLGKKATSVFTIGAQYRSNSDDPTAENDRWYTELAGGAEVDIQQLLGLGMNPGEVMGNTHSDVNLGLLYSSNGKNSSFRTGLTLTHLLSPQRSFLSQAGGNAAQQGLGFILFGQMSSSINKRTTFMPGFIYQKDGIFSELAVQTKLGYELDPEKEISINAGLGYRLGREIQVLLGVDYGKIKGGLSYDLTTGGLSDAANNTFEVGVNYIINIEKKPKVKPVIFCPRL
jgi:type IX secretion system PorP/SprF family membrane protein